MLLPKQLMEQANVITIDETNLLDDEEIDDNHSDHFHIEQKAITVRDILKTPYISEGNVVRCVTGSFD